MSDKGATNQLHTRLSLLPTPRLAGGGRDEGGGQENCLFFLSLFCVVFGIDLGLENRAMLEAGRVISGQNNMRAQIRT